MIRTFQFESQKNLTTKKYLVARDDNDQLTQGGIIEYTDKILGM